MSHEKSTTETTPPLGGLGAAASEEVDSEVVRRALEAAEGSSPGPRWWRDARRRRLLALTDCCSAALALAVVLPPERAIWALAFLPVWVLVAKLAGLYDADHRAVRHLTVDEAPVIVAWAVIGVTVVALLVQLTPAAAPDLGARQQARVALEELRRMRLGAGMEPAPEQSQVRATVELACPALQAA